MSSSELSWSGLANSAFNAAVVPQNRCCPESKISTCVQMSSTIASRWELTITAAPAAAGDRRVVGDYRAGKVSQKVARLILSYVDYVNAIVWRKPV